MTCHGKWDKKQKKKWLNQLKAKLWLGIVDPNDLWNIQRLTCFYIWKILSFIPSQKFVTNTM